MPAPIESDSCERGLLDVPSAGTKSRQFSLITVYIQKDTR
jgi:hypothetical protein